MSTAPTKRKRIGASTTSAAAPPALKEPSPSDVKAAARWHERPAPVSVEISNGALVQSSDPAAFRRQCFRLGEALGTRSIDVIGMVLGHFEMLSRRTGTETVPAEVNASLAIVEAVKPENELEGVLAVQIACCHSMATRMMNRASTTDRVDHLQLYASLAIKLQRNTALHIEALGKLRGNASQSVRVEHVHVYEGGQAVVGNIQQGTRRGEAASNKEDQSHAT